MAKPRPEIRETCPTCGKLRTLTTYIGDRGGYIPMHSATVKLSGHPEGNPLHTVTWALESGGHVQSGEQARFGRCPGVGKRSAEHQAHEAAKSVAKREASIAVSREEAAIALDALIHDRPEFGDDDTRERFAKAALTAYRLVYTKARPAQLFAWSLRTDKRGEIFCLFCGCLVVTFPSGAWIRMESADRWIHVGRHTMTCALSFLAGILEAVPPGTKRLAEQLTLGEQQLSFEDATP